MIKYLKHGGSMNKIDIKDFDNFDEDSFSFDECYRWAIIVSKLLFPVTYNDDFFKYNLKNVKLELKLKDICGFNLIEWLKEQKTLYENGLLLVDKIVKLQSLGLIPEGCQFSDEDYLVYNNFCKLVGDIDRLYDVDYGKVNIEEQLFFVKRYVDKYYFYKSGQGYTLEDYIQECIVALIEARNNYYNIDYSFGILVERTISKHLKKFFKIKIDESSEYYNLDNLGYFDDGYCGIFYQELLEIVDNVSGIFTDAEKYVFNSCFLEGKSQNAVAAELGVSHQRVTYLVAHIKEKIADSTFIYMFDGYVDNNYRGYNDCQIEILTKMSKDRIALMNRRNNNIGVGNLLNKNIKAFSLIEDYFYIDLCDDYYFLLEYFYYLKNDSTARWSNSTISYIDNVIKKLKCNNSKCSRKK